MNGELHSVNVIDFSFISTGKCSNRNDLLFNPRANGAKRCSGRKPGVRERALGKLKVVDSSYNPGKNYHGHRAL